MRTFTLRPRPPLRAFVLGALVSVVGALVTVLAAANAWPLAALVAGIVLIIAGVVLVVGGFASMRVMRVFVDVDDEGFRVRGAGADKRRTWAEVSKVVLADGGTRLVFSHGEVERTHLWCPAGADDPEFLGLIGEVSRRLDKSRGYTTSL